MNTLTPSSTAATRRVPQLRMLPLTTCERSCLYCRPSGEAAEVTAERLCADQVVAVAGAYAAAGGWDIKFSGGDPALWPPLLDAVAAVRRVAPRAQLSVISRRPTLVALAASLAERGVNQLNVSLDSLDDSLHRRITGRDDLPGVIDAIRACVRTGVPTKLNTVLMRGMNEHEVPRLVRWCADEGISELKLLDVIRDLHDAGTRPDGQRARRPGPPLRDLYSPTDEAARWLEGRAVGQEPRLQGGLGHPMRAFRMASGLEVVLKDHRAGSWYGPRCRGCGHFPCHDALMSLRLTPAFGLQTCLLSPGEPTSLAGRSPEGIAEAVQCALGEYASASFEAPALREVA